MHTLDIAPLHSESPPQKRSGMARVLKGSHSFTCTPTHTFIRNRNEPYLPLPSQPQLVLICRPQRDGRLRSRPWCEVAQAEIRTRKLPTANPALYHTVTSAPALSLINRHYCYGTKFNPIEHARKQRRCIWAQVSGNNSLRGTATVVDSSVVCKTTSILPFHALMLLAG